MYQLVLKWIQNSIARLTIKKKILYSYSTAIGIAIIGTSIGLIIGDFSELQAQQQLLIVEEELRIIYRLDAAILDIRNHPQRLAPVLHDSIWFEYEKSKFSTDIEKINKLLVDLDIFINKNSLNNNNNENIIKLTEQYNNIITVYNQFIQDFWDNHNPFIIEDEEKLISQQKYFNFLTGKRAKKLQLDFETLSEQLYFIVQQAETQQKQAFDNFRIALLLRLGIIISSMIISVFIAIILVSSTSRGIADPLEEVTKVAQRVTNESNFELEVPILTEDEVGFLAISFNKLIKWVGEYTNQLKDAKENLENRVKERTLELEDTLSNLQETQSQLIQSEKMSSLGQMVAGVAHEINNPVNFIYGNLCHFEDYIQDLFTLIEFYDQKYPEIDPEIEDLKDTIEMDFLYQDLSKMVGSMKLGSERIKDIVQSLRNFSRLDEAEMKKVDIHEGIDSTLLILNYRIKEGVEIIKNYNELPLVSCYPAQLNQVFMNLISNGIDATEENPDISPQITITTQQKNDLIMISIKDNGMGIPDEIATKLFDPFFTTKPIGKGTGLGLAICYKIIEKHNGKIEFNSEVKKGTEFTVILNN